MLEFLINRINFKILLPAVVIFIYGLISIYSTTEGLYQNHLFYFILGLIIFMGLQYFDVDFFVKYSSYFYTLVLSLLVLIFIVGHTALGASRWLKVGALSIQPSELAKIAVIFFNTKILLGQFFLKLKNFQIKNKFFLSFSLTSFLLLLVIVQPDLGTTIAITLIFIGLIVISNFNKMWFLIAFILLAILSSPLYNALQDYQKQRLIVFISPESDPYGSGYNSIQAKIAVGSGGFLGKGFKKGTQTQLNFLPIFWTDFLVATFAEEWGFIGLIFLMATYSFLIFQIYDVNIKTSVPSYKYISFGILIYFALQFIINFGMNIGLLPVTGIPVPLFSYGGTSLVSSFILLAIINKISIDKSKY